MKKNLSRCSEGKKISLLYLYWRQPQIYRIEELQTVLWIWNSLFWIRIQSTVSFGSGFESGSSLNPPKTWIWIQIKPRSSQKVPKIITNSIICIGKALASSTEEWHNLRLHKKLWGNDPLINQPTTCKQSCKNLDSEQITERKCEL